MVDVLTMEFGGNRFTIRENGQWDYEDFPSKGRQQKIIIPWLLLTALVKS